MTDNAPGWQPDPTGKHDHRYWDGSRWTDNVADAGVAGTDPYDASAAAGDATAVDTPAASEPPAPIDPTVAEPTPSAPDDTATWPAASATPAPPAAPLPYNAPESVPSKDGASKKKLLVGGGILAAIAIAVLGFFLLGDDDDGNDELQARLASKLAEDSDGFLTAAQASCVAEIIVDEAGEDAFVGIDWDAEDAPPAVDAAFESVGEEALFERCDIDPFGGTGSTDDTDDGSTDDTDGSEDDLDSLRDDCADGDFKACDDLYFAADIGSDLEEFGSTCGGIADPQEGFCTETNGGEDDPFTGGELPLDDLADIYESMGLDREQAECLAEGITEAIEDGTLTEEQAVSGFMDFLSECDISLEDISGN